MELDPIQEIRAIRAERMRQFDGDIDKYADFVEEKYRSADLNFVPAVPKRIKPVKMVPAKTKSTKVTKKAARTTKRKRSA